MSADLPSFDKAQYALAPTPGTSTQDQCTLCKTPITASYYRINGDIGCESCASQATSTIPTDSHAAYTRAILYGIGAAIIGMMMYAQFEIATGITIGYLAIGVGYLVGKAMKFGSKGRGGRRYQIAAAILTYAAVSMAAIPVAIHEYKTKPAQITGAPPPPDSPSVHPYPGDVPEPAQSNSQPASFGMAVLTLIGIGLASPFMELADGFGGIIGLFILFIGVRAAWSLTAGHDFATNEISGPFAAAPTPS